MNWMGHVAQTGMGEKHTGFWWVNMKKRGLMEYLGIDGRIMLFFTQL